MSVKAVRVKDIMGVMEEIAPKKLAENWDKPGLAIGDPEREVKKILVALDVIDPVVEEAKRIGADMIVTHHPMLLFRKIESITADTLLGKRIFNLIQNNIAAFSAHTNLDVAAGGTNDVLAELAGLKNIEILEETWAESLKKIVVYVPAGYEQAVRDAMCGAGQGISVPIPIAPLARQGREPFFLWRGQIPSLVSRADWKRRMKSVWKRLFLLRRYTPLCRQCLRHTPMRKRRMTFILWNRQGKRRALGALESCRRQSPSGILQSS